MQLKPLREVTRRKIIGLFYLRTVLKGSKILLMKVKMKYGLNPTKAVAEG